MNIPNAMEKCKAGVSRFITSCREGKQKVPRDVLIMTVIIGASSASFGLGYLAGVDVQGQGSAPILETAMSADTSSTGQVVASKTGTRYYLPLCAGADRISDANKVWFASAELARAAGYAPAANCAF